MSLIYRLFYPKKYYTTGDTIGVLNDSIPRITPPLRNILYINNVPMIIHSLRPRYLYSVAGVHSITIDRTLPTTPVTT